MRKLIISTVLFFIGIVAYNQTDSISNTKNFLDYSRVREYVIADVKVTGVEFLQPGHLVTISGLNKGMKIEIPGPKISEAIDKYWKYGLFSDVKIVVIKIEDGNAYLEIQLKEQPRLSQFEIIGLKKSDKDEIKEKINLRRGIQITENTLNNTRIIIKKHFVEKGFFNVDVNIKQKEDTSGSNLINLVLKIDKNKRVKILKINIEGNSKFKDKRLLRTLKKTKQRDLNIFKGSKYIAADYKEDKIKLLEFYNKNGYRDAKIVSDELVHLNRKHIELNLSLFEGNQYHLRSVSWIGNTKYPATYLNAILGMKHGDIYDQKLLNERLREDEDAITTLYMDNGYLFFSINPVETKVENDSIDLEIRIYEGKQATLNNIIIKGNTKTNERVVRRELYTRPGELFSRTDIIRSVRELATLGHFNPESISPNPIPNQSDGTVDIEYLLEERANDQLELSGGWGGSYGFLGTVRVKFSNFSMRRFFDASAWRPVPSGDGQTLQLGVQTSGKVYQSYSISFVEPWFGGKKPNSLSTSIMYSNRRPYGYNNADTTNSYFRTIGASVGFGKRLKWPDDYFSIYSELSLQQYRLNNYYLIPGLTNGKYNLFSLKLALARSSQDQMIYPRKGSSFTLGLRLTPPYSLFSDKDYSTLPSSEKFKFIEFHKWNFNSSWYSSLVQNLVLALHAEFGYLGAYNSTIGPPPFERFEVGGSGLSGYDVAGTDIVALRGYDDGTLTLKIDGIMYTRYYAELRYPVTLNPSATIYGLAFIEGGNAAQTWSSYNPFDLKRSVGVGLRAFLPMFGLLGVDVGYGFDKVYDSNGFYDTSKWRWHFVLGQQF